MDILQITKPTEYFRRLEVIRSGQHDIKKAIKDVPDPLEIHHKYVEQIPSFKTAQASALKGEIYCWYCASPKIVKNGHKDKSSWKHSFKCHDCKSRFSYGLTDEIYKNFNGLKYMTKGKYKPRKK